jgi:UDP:flavonoid glycosyltransferase YjiC (YdhE family)
MHGEQAGNISLVERRGAGILLSRLDLSRRRLESSLEKLVTDISYRENMGRLKNLQDRVDGAANAAREMIRFMESGA